MNRPLDVLKNVRIAAPCSQPWHKMEGDDRVRFCKECKLNVYNLSDMTAKEAAALVQEREGRLCVGFYMRADGSIITSNCPVGIRKLRKRLVWLATSAAALLGFSLTTIASMTNSRGQSYFLRNVKPFNRIVNWLDPPNLTFTAGVMAKKATLGVYGVMRARFVALIAISIRRSCSLGLCHF